MTSSQVKREYLQTRFRNNSNYNLISIYGIFRQEGRRCQPAVLYLYLQFNLFLPLLWRPAPSPPHCITELKSLISTYQVNNLHGNEKLQTRKPENQKPVTGLVCQVCQAWPAIPVWRLLLTAKTKFYYITRTTDICFSCLRELGYKILNYSSFLFFFRGDKCSAEDPRGRKGEEARGLPDEGGTICLRYYFL